MQLYQTQAQSLVELIEDPFRLEREIQSLTGFRSRKSGLRNYRIQA